jgi:hypothetical protein
VRENHFPFDFKKPFVLLTNNMKHKRQEFTKNILSILVLTYILGLGGIHNALLYCTTSSNTEY